MSEFVASLISTFFGHIRFRTNPVPCRRDWPRIAVSSLSMFILLLFLIIAVCMPDWERLDVNGDIWHVGAGYLCEEMTGGEIPHHCHAPWHCQSVVRERSILGRHGETICGDLWVTLIFLFVAIFTIGFGLFQSVNILTSRYPTALILLFERSFGFSLFWQGRLGLLRMPPIVTTT